MVELIPQINVIGVVTATYLLPGSLAKIEPGTALVDVVGYSVVQALSGRGRECISNPTSRSA